MAYMEIKPTTLVILLQGSVWGIFQIIAFYWCQIKAVSCQIDLEYLEVISFFQNVVLMSFFEAAFVHPLEIQK